MALSAQVGLNRIYKESHQSVDLVSMFSPVTKWSDLILTPGSIPEMVRKAFKLAQTERPGSVYLGVPEDVEAAFVRRSAEAARGQQAPCRRAVALADRAGRGGAATRARDRSSWPGTGPPAPERPTP